MCSSTSPIGKKRILERLRGCGQFVESDHPDLDPALAVNHHVMLGNDGRLISWVEPAPRAPVHLQPWLDEAVTFDYFRSQLMQGAEAPYGARQ